MRYQETNIFFCETQVIALPILALTSRLTYVWTFFRDVLLNFFIKFTYFVCVYVSRIA